MMHKFRCYFSMIFHALFIFTPAKTGSTYVGSRLGIGFHAHSFFADRVYFYRYVKLKIILRRLNSLVFISILAVRSLINIFTRRNLVVLIPLRSEAARRNSLLRDLLIPLTYRVYKSKEYRDRFHGDRHEMLDFLERQLDPAGMRNWLKDHKIPSCVWQAALSGEIQVYKPWFSYNVSFLIFEVRDFETIPHSYFAGNNPLDGDAEKNTSSNLWYASIFKD